MIRRVVARLWSGIPTHARVYMAGVHAAQAAEQAAHDAALEHVLTDLRIAQVGINAMDRELSGYTDVDLELWAEQLEEADQ